MSTIKSSAENLTLNADGANNDIKFQSNGSEVARIDQAGLVTASALAVDNITIDGTEIDLSSGDLTIDVAGDIILDADGGDINFKDNGTSIFHISNDNSGDVHLESQVSNKDIYIRGNDGGSTINALYFDMSEGGKAIFNSGLALGGTGAANTLDDYEEGTFTATLTGASSAPNTAVTETAYYTKIGRLVTVNVFFNNVNTTGASGDARITGLPFTIGRHSFGSYIAYHSLDYTANSINTAIQFELNQTHIMFMDGIDSGAWENSHIIAGSGKYINLSGTYQV